VQENEKHALEKLNPTFPLAKVFDCQGIGFGHHGTFTSP
jgi:hypothetical protein